MTLRKFDICSAGVAVAVLCSVAGCSGLSVAGLSARQYYETRVIQGNKAAVFNACQDALEAMHYDYQSGSPGSGRLEMQGGMQPGGTAQTLRQRLVKVAVTSLGELNAEVSIGFWDYSEDVSMGGTVTASGRLVRGGILYEAFWSTLDEYKPEVPETGEVVVPDASGT